ncbi:MAG: hypothetical protein NTU94_08940, partial [Planctomycetota bacterium]|nr:hypothetical protein [Planctomycetota bacterium]
ELRAMRWSACAVFVSTLVFAFSGSLSADMVEVPGVPDYSYYEGCRPTAAGRIIGYWDANGALNLIPQPKDLTAIRTMMASPEHFYDYVYFTDGVHYGTGKDRLDVHSDSLPSTYHTDNSLADFMWSSRGGAAADSESLEGKQIDGLVGYAKQIGGYSNASGGWETYTYLWDRFVAEINANRPMEFYVASVGKESSPLATPDHFVTAFGYRDTQGHPEYKFYDTTGGAAQWADFTLFVAGQQQQWSIQSGTYFTAPEPATFAFLALGCSGLLVWARKRRVLSRNAAG